MALAFVLVKTGPGHERSVLTKLLDVAALQEVFPLFGEYDLILKLEAPDFDAMGQAVVSRIRTIPGVVRTHTLTVTTF